MVSQVNLKFQDDFYTMTKDYASSRGYMSIQEFIREAVRDKIFDELEVSEEYKKVLQSKEANTFLSEEESEKFHEELKRKAGLL